MPTKTSSKEKTKDLLAGGHRACAGCGQLIAARIVAQTLGPDTIIANGTGCLEVTTSPYPESSWRVPWIHSLFENAAAVASGIQATLKKKGLNKKIKVVAQGGDGSTFDIGFGLISGMWERAEDILYVCYNNEAYANTGVQASGATPFGATTTTTPSGDANPIGSLQVKKDMIAIALAHGLRYVAETTSGYPDDIANKVSAALEVEGPSYIQILVPCVPGWKTDPAHSVKIGKLAAQTGLYPLLEYVDGELVKVMKTPRPKIKVEEFLKLQGRFKHLFETKEGKAQIEWIQNLADSNIKKFGL